MAREFTTLRLPRIREEHLQSTDGKTESRWEVTYYDHTGKRRRRYHRSKNVAQTAALIIQNRFLTEGIQASRIAPGLREEAIACQELLKCLGLTLRKATEFTIKNYPRKADKTLNEVVEIFIANRKGTRNNRPRTVTEYRRQLRHFCKPFGKKLLDAITPSEIEGWLTQRHLDTRFNKMKPWAPRTRNSARASIITLYNFALKKTLCSVNPARAVDKAIVEDKQIEVWTPQEVKTLLEAAIATCKEVLPYLVLGFFSGIRGGELLKLEPDMIKMPELHIVVPANISKTRKLRRVPISGNLAAWLTFCVDSLNESSTVWDIGGYTGLQRRYRTLEAATGYKWKNNGLRCCFASYHIAMYDNEFLTSRACGNSPKMLRDHYDAVVTKQAARIYWEIMPSTPKLLKPTVGGSELSTSTAASSEKYMPSNDAPFRPCW